MKNRFQLKDMILLVVMATVFISGNVRGQERTVLFETEGSGVSKSASWGLDTAWFDENNLRRGSVFMEPGNVDIVRISFTTTNALVNGVDLGADQLFFINNRLTWVDRWTNPSTTVCINEDSPRIHPWYYDGDGTINSTNWAANIVAHTKRAVEWGRTVVTVAPYNEPDLYRSERRANMQKFFDTSGFLITNSTITSNNIRISGGNTLNTDQANPWYDFLKSRLDEGNTHQLAGNFDNYASFFQNVKANGDHATNDELHNVMEAMVGVEYGMDIGIWWGTAERARGEFVKASDGVRLGYAEHRPNWTAASVYRAPNGAVLGFVGESERQALPTTYRFFSRDRDVFYDGHGPQRAYTVTTTGGSGYQTANHRGAERVVNITWGEDIQPAITSNRYVLVNRNSHKVMEVASASTANGANIRQNTYTGGLNQQWDIVPVVYTNGGDWSYFKVAAAHSGKSPDVYQFSFDNGGNIVQWDNGGGFGGVNQQWYFEYVEDGWFYIRSRWNNKGLDVSGASTADGANIQQWDVLGGQNQQWRLLPVGAAIEFVAPAAPTGLNAMANASSVSLSWNANLESDLDGYTVLRSTTSGGPYEIIARGLTGTSHTDHAANLPMTYYYVVRAEDESLNISGNSGEVGARPSGVPTLVAHYEFEGNSGDSSINGNDGTVSGGIDYVSGGVGLSYCALDGAEDHVDLPAEVVNFDQVTIAAWVLWYGGGNWQRIFDFGNLTDEYMFLTPDSGAGMRFAIKNGGGEEQLNTSALPIGSWTHVAVTLSNQTAMLYVDGVNVASSINFTNHPSDFNPVLNHIGKSQFGNDPLFNGGIDDFRIYNHALNEAEVVALAESGPAPPVELPIALVNADFEAGVANFPDGFDADPDVPGWIDYNITDAGVEGGGAWWGTYSNGYSAFMAPDNGAYLLTGYVIRPGDEFTVGFVAKTWWGGSSVWTATLFYDNPANVIGSYSPTTTGDWVEYSSSAIPATAGSVGGTLGILFVNTGGTHSALDDVSLIVTSFIPPDTTPPEVPAGFAATSADASVDLGWADNTEEDLTGYTVYRSIASGGNYMSVASSLGASVYTDHGVTNGTRYYYVVTAADSNGNESAYSAEAGAVPSAAVSSNEFLFADHAIVGGTNLSLTVSDSVPGHDYGLLATDTLMPPNWTNILVEAGNGSNLLFSIPIGGIDTNRFFKLDVQRQ